VAGAIAEQQRHTPALLQAVSAVDDRVVWVSGHDATSAWEWSSASFTRRQQVLDEALNALCRRHRRTDADGNSTR